MNKDYFIETFGWYGAIALLGSYALASFAVISMDSMLYLFLNITGAIGIVVSCFHKRAYPAAVLNSVWAAVGLVILIRMLI